MTTITLSAKEVGHRFKSLSMPAFSWKAVYGLAIMALAVMLVVYVALINNLTQGSYLIKSYNKQIDAFLPKIRTCRPLLPNPDFWAMCRLEYKH